MTSKITTLRERFFSNLAAVRNRDSETKRKRSLIKRVMKKREGKATA